MTRTKPTTFTVSACLLVAASIVLGATQERERSGLHGIPVEGHEIVAGVMVTGTKHLDLSRSAWEKLRERLRTHGAELRLGWPLQSQTVCRFKEVIRDVMREKGFPDADITLDRRPTFGNPLHLTLNFTIVEGERSRRASVGTASLSPAERCMR